MRRNFLNWEMHSRNVSISESRRGLPYPRRRHHERAGQPILQVPCTGVFDLRFRLIGRSPIRINSSQPGRVVEKERMDFGAWDRPTYSAPGGGAPVGCRVDSNRNWPELTTGTGARFGRANQNRDPARGHCRALGRQFPAVAIRVVRRRSGSSHRRRAQRPRVGHPICPERSRCRRVSGKHDRPRPVDGLLGRAAGFPATRGRVVGRPRPLAPRCRTRCVRAAGSRHRPAPHRPALSVARPDHHRCADAAECAGRAASRPAALVASDIA